MYFTDRGGRRYLKSCVVEIPGSEMVEMPHLPRLHFPILSDTTDLKSGHGGPHKRCTIKRKQVPIKPRFSMTIHKAHCAGAEPRCGVMCPRATSLDGLAVLWDFNDRLITKRRGNCG